MTCQPFPECSVIALTKPDSHKKRFDRIENKGGRESAPASYAGGSPALLVAALASGLRGVCAAREGEDQPRICRFVIHPRARRKYQLVKTIQDHDFLRDKNPETRVVIGLQAIYL